MFKGFKHISNENIYKKWKETLYPSKMGAIALAFVDV